MHAQPLSAPPWPGQSDLDSCLQCLLKGPFRHLTWVGETHSGPSSPHFPAHHQVPWSFCRGEGHMLRRRYPGRRDTQGPLSYRRKNRRALEAEAHLQLKKLTVFITVPVRLCTVFPESQWCDRMQTRQMRVTRDEEKMLPLFFLPCSLSWLTFTKEQTHLFPFSPHEHQSPGISLKVHLSLITLRWLLPRILLTHSTCGPVSVDTFSWEFTRSLQAEGGKQRGHLGETLHNSDNLWPRTKYKRKMCLLCQGLNKHSLEAHMKKEGGQRAVGARGMAGLEWVTWWRVRGLERTCPHLNSLNYEYLCLWNLF